MNRTMADQIYQSLNNQCRCNPVNHKFFFRMNYQKVMLITWTPSFQAVYRPLSSIRFFRTIFLALFGARPKIKSGEMVNTFLNRIYWTHYYKCFHDRKEDELYPEKLTDKCYKKYMQKEVRALSPKLIILLGKPFKDCFKEFLTEKKGYLWGIPVIYKGFPDTGCEQEYLEIRIELKKYAPEVDDSDEAISLEHATRVSKEANTIKVHADFELDGLKTYWKIIKDDLAKLDMPTLCDDAWYKSEMVPRWTRYSFIVSCYSFMEDQLKPLITYQGKNPGLDEQTLEDLLRLLEKKNKLEGLLPRLFMKNLECIRKLRNCIVHKGGILEDYRTDRDVLSIPGVMLEPSGCAVVTNKTFEFYLQMVNEFVGIITQFTPTPK